MLALPRVEGRRNGDYPKPETVSASFLEEGHVIEFLEYPYDRNRAVALFFGPGEFLIRCHPVFSTLQCIDDGQMADFTYSAIIRTLRKFPETYAHYKDIQQRYEQKAAERIKLARLPNDEDRFRLLQKTQSWVLSLVMEDIVAGYLGVSRERLRELKGGT